MVILRELSGDAYFGEPRGFATTAEGERVAFNTMRYTEGEVERIAHVVGQGQTSGETFTGTATGYTNGGGTVTFVSSRGGSCTGDFVYVTRRQGEGIVVCADGRSGPFSFVSTGSRGTGHGRLASDAFTFTFGG